MPTRLAFRTALREAAVTMLRDYGQAANLGLTVTTARPRRIHPPHAFIDNVRETILYTGPLQVQRTPTIECVVVWGVFDSEEAVAQADRFADEFLEWVTDRVHAAGASTTVGIVGIEDEPTFVNDWLPPDLQATYYASRLSLEGFANA